MEAQSRGCLRETCSELPVFLEKSLVTPESEVRVMNETDVRVVLATQEHRLEGVVPADGRRLLDVLNDSSTGFLRVFDTSVFRRHDDKRLAVVREAVVRKANIGLAIPVEMAHEASEKRFQNYVQKRQYSVFLVVLGYHVRGVVQLKKSTDPVAALTREMGTFLPVPNGEVSIGEVDFHEPEAPVVIVNQDLVSLFSLAESKAATSAQTSAAEESATGRLPSD